MFDTLNGAPRWLAGSIYTPPLAFIKAAEMMAMGSGIVFLSNVLECDTRF